MVINLRPQKVLKNRHPVDLLICRNKTKYRFNKNGQFYSYDVAFDQGCKTFYLRKVVFTLWILARAFYKYRKYFSVLQTALA
jgi:hypothetical protein